jgi:cysteine desulfurase
MSGVYLDHAASRPLDPRVADAMVAALRSGPGSTSGLHEWARGQSEAIEHAREHVAALIGAGPESIIFTSGATEARNLAVKGLLAANPGLGRHVVASAVEHPATLAACRTSTRSEGTLTLVPVDGEARIDPRALAEAIGGETALVNVVHGQAEVGTVQDVAALTRAAKSRRPEVLVHVDGDETVGLLPVAVDEIGCDALSFGGGSLAGPEWCGALYVRPGTRLHPLVEGGLQEHGKRGGAEDVPGIVALGEAARIAMAEGADRARRVRELRDVLIGRLLALPGVHLNGPGGTERLPGNVQVSVEGVEGETLVLALAARGVAASPGSACSAAGKASPVLEAMGVDPMLSHSALLLTLDWRLSLSNVESARTVIADVVERLRAMSPVRVGALAEGSP